MERGALLGIIGGLAVFLILLSFIIYNHYDFDQHLIDQVDNGVPAEKLIPQIDNENINLQLDAKRHFESIVMDKKNWGNGELVSPTDFQLYAKPYENVIKVISDYVSTQKKFARREITKEQFLQEIRSYKEFFNSYQVHY